MPRRSFLLLFLIAAVVVHSARSLAYDALPGRDYSGTLAIVWGDALDSAGPTHTRYSLRLDDGRLLNLVPGDVPAAELDGYYLQAVRVRGRAVTGLTGSTGGDQRPAIAVDAIRAGPADRLAAAPAIAGNNPWLSVGCKFADVAAEPRPINYFAAMYAGTYPGLDHYWREASYGQMDLAGSTAAGWFDLPKTRAAYLTGSNPDLNGLFQRLHGPG
jgi:hypothetical protein